MATTKFIDECKNPANSNRLGEVTIGSTTINQHDYLANIRLSEKCYIDGSVIGTNYSKSVDINALDTFTGTLSSGETINPKLGVKYDDDTTDFIDFGNYTSEVSNEIQTSSSTSFTGYDKLINGDTLYECGITQFPSTVGAFYIDALNQIGLEPQSTTFIGSNIVVKDNPFTASETVRQVLQAVEKVACAFGYINKQGKHELRWFSSSVDYEFDTNDYSTLEGGNLVYGPINRLLIGNSNIKGDYVIREDEQSISQIGANELYIYEPYFLYNDTLRNQVIDEIWNKVNGFTYTKYELTTYYGKPFLEIGNKIKINRNDGTSFESYILSHELNYNGAFTSVISADLMTKEEEEHKNNSKNTSPFAKVEIEINKQNGEIKSVVDEIGYRGEKETTITQDLDRIEGLVKDVADITSTKSTENGLLKFDETINPSEPISMTIYPISEDISYLYPCNFENPSENLFLKNRKIIFINIDKPDEKSIVWELPTDLRRLNDKYDELIIDYKNGGKTSTCVVKRRIGINYETGDKYILDNFIDEPYEFPHHINLTEGKYDIYLTGYKSGYLEARLMVKNLYTAEFATKVELNSSIEETVESITGTVNKEIKRLDDTIESTTTSLSISIDGVKSEVKKKVGEDEVISKINQSSEEVTIEANKVSLAGKNINLTSDNIAISSTNFNVDKNGNVKANNCDINGKITSNNGEIGGWIINENGMTNNVVKLNSDGSSTIYTVADLIIIRGYIMYKNGVSGYQAFALPDQMIKHYDLNGDGEVTTSDYQILQNLIGIRMN